MGYNRELLKNDLSEITKTTFEEAIFLAYKDGICSIAPLGFSGDNIILHGREENGRVSLVSIRNYSGDPELLITDINGNFLFYGRFDVNLGVQMLANQYWKIFNLLKDQICKELIQDSIFKDLKIKEKVSFSEGFEILSVYQKTKGGNS